MSPSSSSDRPRTTPRAKSGNTARGTKAGGGTKADGSARANSRTKANKGTDAKRTSKAARNTGTTKTSKSPSSTSRNRARNERASRVTARQLRTRDAASLANREPRSPSGEASADKGSRQRRRTGTVADGLSGLSEQLVNRIIKPLGLVVLSREGISETVNDAVDRGRLTHSDAESLVNELVQLGRQQTDELMSDLERTLGRGRQQLGGATRRARLATPDRIMRSADRARRSIGVGPAFPILGYDDLTVAQVQRRLRHLTDPELRKVRDYERRNARRSSLLDAIEKALG